MLQDQSAQRGPSGDSGAAEDPLLGLSGDEVAPSSLFPVSYRNAHPDPERDSRKALARAIRDWVDTKMEPDAYDEEKGVEAHHVAADALIEPEPSVEAAAGPVRYLAMGGHEVASEDESGRWADLISRLDDYFSPSPESIARQKPFIDAVKCACGGAVYGAKEVRTWDRFGFSKSKAEKARYFITAGALLEAATTATALTEVINVFGRVFKPGFSLVNEGLVGLELMIWLPLVTMVAIQQHMVWAVGAELDEREFNANKKKVKEKIGDTPLFQLPSYASRLLTGICIATALIRFCDGAVAGIELLQGDRKEIDPTLFTAANWCLIVSLGLLKSCADFITHTSIALSNHADSMLKRYDFVSATNEQLFRCLFRNYQFELPGGKLMTFSPASVASKLIYLTYALVQGYLHYKAPEKAAELLGVDAHSNGVFFLRVVVGALAVWASQCFEVEHTRDIVANIDPRGLRLQEKFDTAYKQYQALKDKVIHIHAKDADTRYYKAQLERKRDKARLAATLEAMELIHHERNVEQSGSKGLIDPRSSVFTRAIYPSQAYESSPVEFMAGFTRLAVELIHLTPIMEALYLLGLREASKQARSRVFAFLLGLVSVGTSSLFYVGLNNVVLGGTFHDLLGAEVLAKDYHSAAKTTLVLGASLVFGFALNLGRLGSLMHWGSSMDSICEQRSSENIITRPRENGSYSYQEYNKKYISANSFWHERVATFVAYFGGSKASHCLSQVPRALHAQ